MKKASATVLLFGFALFILIDGSLIILLPAIAASTDGTHIGRVLFDETETACMIHGYAFAVYLMITYDMLAFISIDRFFNIVKPLVHKHYFKPKYVAIVMVSLWLVILLVATTPFFATGTEYTAVTSVDYICYDMGVLRYVVAVIIVIDMVIVAVTSSWTFLFTRNFLKRFSSSQQQSSQDVDSIYNRKVCKLFGVISLQNFTT